MNQGLCIRGREEGPNVKEVEECCLSEGFNVGNETERGVKQYAEVSDNGSGLY